MPEFVAGFQLFVVSGGVFAGIAQRFSVGGFVSAQF